jgi:hypothetical protein
VRHDFIVVMTPADAAERFAILWRDTLPLEQFARSRSLEDVQETFRGLLASAPQLTEGDMRAQLAGMGLPPDDIDDQIDRARRMQATSAEAMNRGDFAWETTTRPGYRNSQAQDLIRKTGLAGTLPLQKVFVLRCGECGHEYGANGSEVHSRRCPACQGGPPGLSIEIA